MQGTLDLVGGAGDKPRLANDGADLAEHRRGSLVANVRDKQFDAEELEWFASVATDEQLTQWYVDMCMLDDDVGCRTQRTRQLRTIMRRRGLLERTRAAVNRVPQQVARTEAASGLTLVSSR